MVSAATEPDSGENPYSPPSPQQPAKVSAATQESQALRKRSLVAAVLAVATLATGVFLGLQWSRGIVKLGEAGYVALPLLLLAAVALLMAARFYRRGARGYGVAFGFVGMIFFTAIVLLALSESGALWFPVF